METTNGNNFGKGLYRTANNLEARVTRIRMHTIGWIMEGAVRVDENVWMLCKWNAYGQCVLNAGLTLDRKVA